MYPDIDKEKISKGMWKNYGMTLWNISFYIISKKIPPRKNKR